VVRGGKKTKKKPTEVTNWTKKNSIITISSSETELKQFSSIQNSSVRFETLR